MLKKIISLVSSNTCNIFKFPLLSRKCPLQQFPPQSIQGSCSAFANLKYSPHQLSSNYQFSLFFRILTPLRSPARLSCIKPHILDVSVSPVRFRSKTFSKSSTQGLLGTSHCIIHQEAHDAGQSHYWAYQTQLLRKLSKSLSFQGIFFFFVINK